MANHCWNWVYFTGKKEDLQRLHDGLRKAESLNAENYGLIWYETFYTALGLEPPEQTADVYDEFGSKWLDIHDIDMSDEHLEFSASSAWSPVSAFLLKLSKASILSLSLSLKSVVVTSEDSLPVQMAKRLTIEPTHMLNTNGWLETLRV